MKLKPRSISVVIPALNEGGRLDASLQSICGWLSQRQVAAEIVVVDDGSDDDTAAIARRWQGGAIPVQLIRHERNHGKGAAVRSGVLAARSDLILVSDADLSTPIAEADKLLSRLDEAAVVIGSRTAPEAELRVPQRWLRQLLGKIFNLILRASGLTVFRDTQCGFKLWRREAARAVFAASRIDGFAYDVEVLLLAERSGYRIVEVGVVWSNSPQSRVRMVRDSLAMLRAVLGLRLRRSRWGAVTPGAGAEGPQ